jgi:hypothetical protein
MAIIGGLFAGALISFLAIVAASGPGSGGPETRDEFSQPVPLYRDSSPFASGPAPATAGTVAEQARGPGVAESSG